MENRIEEIIKTIEKMIKSYKEADECGLSNNDFKNEIKALEHILSDYKRVLKEIEELKEKVISVQIVKDKIEKYKNMCISNVKGYENYSKDNYNELVFRRMEQLEKELLESEE